MTNTEFLNTRIQELSSNTEFEEEKISTVINVRPGEKIAAMLDIFALLNGGKLPLLSLSDGISEQLADFLSSNEEHINIIESTIPDIQEVEKSNNAFKLLIERGYIENDIENSVQLEADNAE